MTEIDPQLIAECGVRTPDTIQEALNTLNGIFGLSWRKIAALRAFAEIGIPAGTLCSIAKGEQIPNKYRPGFNLAPLLPAPVCKCGEVHTTKRCTKNDKPRRRRDLFEYSPTELLWMLENRR